LNPVNTNEQNRYTETLSTTFGGELDYSHKFGTQGRNLSFNLQYSNENSDGNSKTRSTTTYHLLGYDSIIDHETKNKNNSVSYRFQASYVEPLSKYHFLQFRYSYRQNNRDQESYTYKNDGSGNYTEMDTLYSNSYKNKYTNQQIHASFKTVREKYNLQIGVNINPQSTQSIRYIAGIEQNQHKRSVTNFGPMAQFQYNFTRSHNIRLDYSTRTSQPSLSQLDPWRDISNPLITNYGNPDLKPSFTHSLDLRYNLNNRSTMRTLTIRLRGSTTQNNIVTNLITNADGTQEIRYDNVNGAWNLGGDIMVNFPINKSFQLNTSSNVQLNHNVSFSNGQKNKTQYNRYMPNLGLQYSTLFMDLGISGTVTFTNTTNSIDTKRDQSIRDYDLRAWTTVYLPLDFTFVSDISFRSGSGYAAGYDASQTVWNAGIEKSILKNRGALKFTINDILRDKKNISYSSTDNYIEQRLTNTLNCYFMLSFTYRFNVFGGQSVNGSSGMPMRINSSGGGMMIRRN
jgi:hypothetical protein